MDWFSRHTNWLYRETKELSNSSIYKEHYQFIDKTLISTGEILVHKSQTEYYPILIVYPEATPYMPPTVYMLNNSIDECTARKYSSLLPTDIRSHVQTSMKCLDRRHQNSDGSVCFVETGDLHSENAEAFIVKEIIKRLRIWLSGKIPKDSREVELFHHFNNKTHDLDYLLPDLFFETEIVKGSFYAGLSVYIPNVSETKTYIGVTIFGENKSGVSLLPKTCIKKQLIFWAHIPDIEKLLTNNEDKNKEIENGRLIEGYWWDISVEPEPFSFIKELTAYIGDGNDDNGLKELLKVLEKPLSRLWDEIHIGLRFPGRWNEKDWQMFRLKRGNRNPIIPTIETREGELRERLLDYSIEAVHQEYFTEEYFHMRNKGRAERNVLKNSTISVIGCGALGSETADALGKAGVGRMLLVDKDKMRAHNSIRHSLGINKINLPKVFGMAEHLVFHNPFVDIEIPKTSNILESVPEDYLPEGAIGVSTIADDNVEAFLNEQAVNENRTVFYCRALRGGKVARIFRVIPHRDACKSCLSLYSGEKELPFINIEEDKKMPVITNECNNPVRPASAADLKVIAGLFSRIIIDFLQGTNLDKNHWIWATESLELLKLDESSHWLINATFLPPHTNCTVCQRLEDKTVFISKKSYEFMKQESVESNNIETGGVLIGNRSNDGKYNILRATGPGPNAERTDSKFEKDEEYCQKELEIALKELGDKGLYLGEWHYHPTENNFPSGLDIKSLTEIAAQNNYRIDKPIMMIFSKSLECAITIHDISGQCVKLNIEVCNNMHN